VAGAPIPGYDTAESDDRAALAAYRGVMRRMPGAALAAGGAGGAARPLWAGLRQVLAGPDPAPARRSRSPRQARAAQAGLGAATLALGLVSVISVSTRPGASFGLLGRPPASAGQILLAIAVVAPLPLAARYPLLAWRIGWLELLLAPLVPGYWWGGWPWGPAQVLALLAAFCVAGIRHRRPVLWCMWALTLIPWWLWLGTRLADLNGPASATLIFAAAAIAADSVSSRLRAQRALATQAERTELEQARRAVLEERTRIARELHDIVAHHMSLIAVRAESAPHRIAGLPEPALAEFGALSDAARDALADMRRLLGVLRDDQPAGRAPQPQLSDLPVLIGTARRAGVPVELSVAAALGQVPAGVGVCAYRIVQESLSNASQHAPGAAVTVSVERDASAVLLRVVSGPGQPGGPGRNGAGHGLAGMRERVALLGGSLAAGPAAGGGFVVSAVLPLGAAA
jgi:signal transduction histidine kinase